MKKEELFEVLGDIGEEYICEARRTVRKKTPSGWLKWGCAAACLAAAVTAAAFIRPTVPNGIDDPVPSYTDATEETAFSTRYVYTVKEGSFSTYVGGKVIAEDRLGDKVADVTLAAGWQNREGEWLSGETLRGEVYAIEGIPEEVAVALKFLDQGEAVTTTHYYVIVNPDADLSAVEEYVIPPFMPNNTGDE